MVNISQAVRQVKDDLPSLIAPILSQVQAAHPRFVRRERVFTPLSLVMLMITQFILRIGTPIEQCRDQQDASGTKALACDSVGQFTQLNRWGQRIVRFLRHPLGTRLGFEPLHDLVEVAQFPDPSRGGFACAPVLGQVAGTLAPGPKADDLLLVQSDDAVQIPR